MSKFSEWENAHPEFECAKCKKKNTAKEGERLGYCSCGNNHWYRITKEVEE